MNTVKHNQQKYDRLQTNKSHIEAALPKHMFSKARVANFWSAFEEEFNKIKSLDNLSSDQKRFRELLTKAHLEYKTGCWFESAEILDTLRDYLDFEQASSQNAPQAV